MTCLPMPGRAPGQQGAAAARARWAWRAVWDPRVTPLCWCAPQTGLAQSVLHVVRIQPPVWPADRHAEQCPHRTRHGRGHSQGEDSSPLFPLPEQQLGQPLSPPFHPRVTTVAASEKSGNVKGLFTASVTAFRRLAVLHRCGGLGVLAISGKEGISVLTTPPAVTLSIPTHKLT